MAMMMKGMTAVVGSAEGTIRSAPNVAGRRLGRQTPAASSPPAKPPQTEGGDPNALEPTIYRFVLKHSVHQQLILLALTLASFPFLYYSLDLPKTIVNRAIGGKQFPQEFLPLKQGSLPQVPTVLPEQIERIEAEWPASPHQLVL